MYTTFGMPVGNSVNEVAGYYSGIAGSAYSSWQRRLSRRMGPIVARKFLPYVDSTKVVLDFGCGDGSVLEALPARRRLAVEPNPASRNVHNAALLESQESLFTVPERSIDVAISNHALEHCLAPLSALAQIREKVKPNGKLVLIVPIDDWRRQRTYDTRDVNHHLYTWTPQLLGNLLHEAGFQVETIEISRHAWPPAVRFLTGLPPPLFDAVCRVWSRLSLIAEIRAVATLRIVSPT